MNNVKTEIEKLFKQFLKQLGTVYGSLIVVFTLIGFGFSIGKYYQEILMNKEIADLNNKHTLEVIDLKQKIFDLNHTNISMIQNEKKKNKKEIREPEAIFFNIKEIADENIISEESKTKLKNLYLEAEESFKNKKKIEKGSDITILLLFGLFLLASIFSCFNLNEISDLKNDIQQKELIINKLQANDSLYIKYLNVNKDGSFNISIHKEKEMTYKDLEDENNSLKTNIQEKENEISNYLKYIQLDSMNTHMKLYLIKQKYGISIDNTGKIDAPQIDSTFAHLQYLKKKIEEDQKKYQEKRKHDLLTIK